MASQGQGQYAGSPESLDLIERCTMTLLRCWAFLTTLVAWSSLVESLLEGYAMALVLLIDAVVLSLFEFALPIFAAMSRDGPLFRNEFLQHLVFMSDVVKALVYVVLAVLSSLRPHDVWLGLIAGLCLLVLAILRVLCVLLRRQRRSMHRLAERNEQAARQRFAFDDEPAQAHGDRGEGGYDSRPVDSLEVT